MAFNEDIANALRNTLDGTDGIVEKKMFGGIAFMLNGNMCVGAAKDNIMVRVGPDNYERLLQQPDASPMDFTGKPMKGFIYVSMDVLEDSELLQFWVDQGLEFAGSLPKK